MSHSSDIKSRNEANSAEERSIQLPVPATLTNIASQ